MGSGEVQGKLWGSRARDWANFQEPVQEQLYREVFKPLELGPGKKLLDVGCGSGLALHIATELGAEVAGNDASEGLLVIAKERVPQADLRVEDLEETSFQPGTFDIITSFNAVQFAANPINALKRLASVAKPGGQIVIVTWAEPEKSQMTDLIKAIGSLLPPPPPGAAGPFALSTADKLEELAESSGLKPVKGSEVACPFEYADLEAAVSAALSSGVAAMAIKQVGEDKARNTVKDVLENYLRPDGRVRTENTFRYLICKA